MKTPGLFQAIKMVLAGFIGIRKSAASQAVQKLSPKMIILTALGCGIVLIGLLVTLVNLVIYYAQ
jgi:hypothetical protein